MSRSFLKTASGVCVGLLLVGLPLSCSGDDGANGAPGTSTGTLTGTVTNSANGGAAVEGATITTMPEIAGTVITTDASGVYTATLPAGVYQIEVEATNFEAEETGASILAAQTHTNDFSLTPVSNVVIGITGVPETAAPGTAFTLNADVTPMDGSTVTSYAWTQTHSAQAAITGGDTATPSITLGDDAAYKAALLSHLTQLDERFRVMGIDPHSYELGAMVAFECEVVTSSGTFHEEVEVHADLPFATWATGLNTVPAGQPVMLSGMDQATFDWSITAGPSTPTLSDAATRFPYFTPTDSGKYTISVTDLALVPPAAVTFDIYVGDWVGGINGQTAEGRPTTTCAAACHATLLNETFTDWANTGHAEIFTNNINEGGHYSANCFPCHTVGMGSGGMDSTDGYQAFLDAMFAGGMSHPDPDNWDTVLTNHPNQAGMSNIQCEHCHGPNNTPAHLNQITADPERTSTSSEVCATCHGEPPRHARYQQWLESGHGNYDLAIEEGSRGSCAKCHAAQGFVEWSKMAIPFDTTTSPGNLGDGKAEPITCVVCHEPHNVGTRSGNANDVPMRWDDVDSPELLGGFTAYGVGKGSICFICHNTRRGEKEAVITATPDRAPHGGAQGDMVMGFNGFYVSDGIRGPHSLITDTCVACHVQLTPPPADLSYNLGGTNHTFAANAEACENCHGGFDPASLIALADSRLEAFVHEVETAIEAEIAFHIAAGREVMVEGEDANGDPATATITSASTVEVTHFGSSHGRQAMDITVDNVDVLHCQMDGDTTVFDMATDVGSLWDNMETDNGGAILRRVGWNTNLMLADGSSSLHNPGWWQELLVASEAKLAEIRP